MQLAFCPIARTLVVGLAVDERGSPTLFSRCEASRATGMGAWRSALCSHQDRAPPRQRHLSRSLCSGRPNAGPGGDIFSQKGKMQFWPFARSARPKNTVGRPGFRPLPHGRPSCRSSHHHLCSATNTFAMSSFDGRFFFGFAIQFRRA